MFASGGTVFSASFVEEIVLFPGSDLVHLSKINYLWINFWNFYSVALIYMSIFCWISSNTFCIYWWPYGFCSSNDVIYNHLSHKELISWIYQQLEILNNSKQPTQSNPVEKWAKDFKRQFLKKEIQMTKKNLWQKYSTSLTIREMWIKTVMRYLLAPVKWLK